MSHNYTVEVDLAPLRAVDDETDPVIALLNTWEFYPDNFDADIVAPSVCFVGTRSLGGGKLPDEAHAELEKLLGPKVKVATRWRCIDYDQWDDEFGGSND